MLLTQNCLTGLNISSMSVYSSIIQSPFFVDRRPSHKPPIVPIKPVSANTATYFSDFCSHTLGCANVQSPLTLIESDSQVRH